MDINTKVKQRLLKEADEKYRKFSSALVPNINNLLGVRLSTLRKIAKEISKNNWQDYLTSETEYMEETMLKGMVIGLIRENPINLIKDFIPQINNWSVCDSFCCSLKYTQNHKDEIFQLLMKYKNTNKEYEIRFVLVMLLNYFIEEAYLSKIFKIIENYKYNDYYAMMGAAWLVSICYIKYPNDTQEFLNKTTIDNVTYNKSIQKIIESNQIDKPTKDSLRNLKR